MNKILAVLLTIVTFNCSSSIIDLDDFTRFTELNIDVYDVDSFVGLTHAETLNEIENLNGGWRFASMDELRPIYQNTTQEHYLNSLRFLLGSFNAPEGNFITGGRVVDVYPTSIYPDFNYVWGFGTGVLTWDPDPVYVWTSYGMGYDMADLRFNDQGAWAIRDIASSTSIPEPNGIVLTLLIAIFCTFRYSQSKSRGLLS